MKKIFIAACCALLPFFAVAQDKIGYVNTQDIYAVMPERAVLEKTLSDLQTQWENELLKSREEYSAKIKEYQEKQATMPEAIREARQSELASLEERIQTTIQQATADIQKKQTELQQVIVEKVHKAIEEVGAENNYTYIFDSNAQIMPYKSPKANDVTALVKKKLDIK